MSDLNKYKYIIEDGYNTNYISCLILSLFLEKNIINNIFIETSYNNPKIIYIQEIIKKIIFDFKSYNIVNSNILNYFRNILFFENYKSLDKILENNCIISLYDFLYNLYNLPKIEFMNLCEIGKIETCTYLTIKIKENTNIKTLINNNYNTKILNNIPHFLGIYLMRNTNERIEIDIQKKININSIYYYSDMINKNEKNKLIWEISSIICFDNFYYSYINLNNNWILLNEKEIPIIKKINIKDYENDIKLKSLFVIYKYKK